MPGDNRPKLAVSYARVAEEDGASAGEVSRFCEYFRKLGVDVLRDSDNLEAGGDIDEFMKDVAASKVLAIFLGDAYLRSDSCLFELQTAWDRCGGRNEEQRARLMYYVLPDARGILGTGTDGAATRQGYIDHWNSEKSSLEQRQRGTPTELVPPMDHQALRRIAGYASKLGDIFGDVAKTLAPSTLEAFCDMVLPHVGLVGGRGDSELLTAVYRKTNQSLEAHLCRDSLRKFLYEASPGLLVRDGDRWRLTETVRGRNFDLCPYLKAIENRMHQTGVPEGDRKGLAEFLGGLVVLAVSPAWILAQRAVFRSQTVELPADGEYVPLGGSDRASFLHLVAAALADGWARLDRVFGGLDSSDRRMREPAEVGRGILDRDQETEWKRYFICSLMQGEDVNALSGDLLELRFQDALKLMSYALNEEGRPYYAARRELVAKIEAIRSKLNIQDLVLIRPSGCESRDGILTSSVFALKHLKSIYDLLYPARSAGSP